MGGRNPIEDIIEGAADFAVDTATGGFLTDAIGIDNPIRDTVEGIVDPLVGEISGQNRRLAEEAEDAQVQAAEKARQDQAQREQDAAIAEEERLDQRRQAQGSRSRTLLTGPSGVEEDETNLARRTLIGS